MTSLPNRLSLCLCVLWIFVTVIQGDFVDLPPDEPIQSLEEGETVLPCRYQPKVDNVVVQVTWYITKPGADKEMIITAHRSDGQRVFGTWSQRVRFQSSDPISDSSMVIINTAVSDEGKYTCHISTFPSGNFDSEMSLIVWTAPISSLDPVILVEGQSYRQVASCRSVARPLPRLSWDTDLTGQSVNRTTDTGVSSHYSLHPLRSMNGKKLDCLVWHPTFKTPRRLQNKVVVYFPPNAEVSGYNKDWFLGLENAALRCVSGGNPKPQSFTWTRMGGELPEGVIPHPNGTLAFGRPLSMSDKGTYQCVVKNQVGVAKAEVEIAIPETIKQTEMENLMMIIVGGVAGGLLILMLIIIITVTCHHKRKNKKLKKELTERKEEISTLSRQASFRRMNSISTDTRGATEENIPLRMEGTIRTSLSSLGEQARCRDSRSTISGRGGGGGSYDFLGRPVLNNNSRRGRERLLDRDEENRLRVETYVRNSSRSLQETRFHAPLMPTPFPIVQSTEIVRQLNGSAIITMDGGSRSGSVTKNHQLPPLSGSYPPLTDEEDEEDEGLGGPASQEHPDDQDSETNSSHVSEAHTTHYQQPNGTLRPKPRPSPITVNPHTSYIHKAQIV